MIFFAPVLEFTLKYWILGLGFFSQGIFGIRMLIQWYLSEKEGKIVSPIIFWHLSLVAGFLFLVYGVLRHDFVIILGQAISHIISIRNLQLEGAWKPTPLAYRVGAIALPIIVLAWFIQSTTLAPNIGVNDFLKPVFIVGAIGQLALNLRFVYQWYYAEKEKTSSLPIGFWLMTATGSILVVIYAIFPPFDPVLLFAQGLGLFAALRNIQLHYKSKAE